VAQKQAASLRERIGLQMQELEGRQRPRERSQLAQVAKRSPRTLRTWKKKPRGERPGRPPHSLEKSDRARRLVIAELRLQGWTASTNAIDVALKLRNVPTRLTRTWVGAVKQAIAADKHAYMQEMRVRVLVLGPDVMTAIDATHVCREPVVEITPALSESSGKTNGDLPSNANEGIETAASRSETTRSRGRAGAGSPCRGACRAARRRRGRAIQALMAIDVATTLKLGFKIVHAPTGRNVIDLLIAIRAERGTFPLVLMSDNGSENVNDDVEPFLEENRIIHLRNLPRTPRHNPAVERSHREVKAEARLDMQSLDPALDLVERVRISIGRAVHRLNHHRRRESREWKTAAQLDTDLPRPYTVVARDVFYAVASAAMRMARDSPGPARQQRLAERWALYTVMEAFGLIKLFRGGVPITALKAAGLT
jgi:transposase InsO family protein